MQPAVNKVLRDGHNYARGAIDYAAKHCHTARVRGVEPLAGVAQVVQIFNLQARSQKWHARNCLGVDARGCELRVQCAALEFLAFALQQAVAGQQLANFLRSARGRHLQLAGNLFDERSLALQVFDGCGAGDGFNAAHARRYGAFTQNYKRAKLAGVRYVRSAAQLQRDRFGCAADAHGAHNFAILFAEERHGTAGNCAGACLMRNADGQCFRYGALHSRCNFGALARAQSAVV